MPLPVSISYMWNLGSMLGLMMSVQVMTGLMLSMHYVPHVEHSFTMVINIMMDMDSGSMLRYLHCNVSSLLFMLVYLHMFKGMYYNSYSCNSLSWLSGSVIYLLMMLTAFLGYVLPWGQMSYWGATVISSLITTIPILGKWLLIMIWGDYSVNNSVLNRFFALHFIIPFLIIMVIMVHLVVLHSKGSTTVISHNKIMLPFSSYFILKDLLGFLVVIIFLMVNISFFPSFFLDSENWIMASPLTTPIHIVPEWYFLYAYCVLKSFDDKVVGVLMLLLSVAFFPLMTMKKHQSYNVWHKLVMITWLVNFIFLTKMGAMELSYPFTYVSTFCVCSHFLPWFN